MTTTLRDVARLAGVGLTLVALTAWRVVPGLLGLTKADVDGLTGPAIVIVAAMAVAYPLRVFGAALVGLQDVVFTGCLGVGQTIELRQDSFRDQYGEAFRGGGFFATRKPQRVDLVQLETSDGMLGLVAVGKETE